MLILGDLDYFKLINDRFGHLVGDQVLKAVAQRISASLRRSDLAFRIGGEEFAIILHRVQPARRAPKWPRRSAGASTRLPVTLESGQNVFPTMSFGAGRAGRRGQRGPVRPGGPGAVPGQAQGPQPHRGPAE